MERLNASLSHGRFAGALACALAAVFALQSCVPDVAAAASRRKPSSRTAIKAPQCPQAGSRAVGFAKALDGTSFLTTDGMEVRLAGVLSPGEVGETLSAPKADAARQTLASALRSGALMLAPGDAGHDRYGRALAQVFVDGAWVQGAMLRAGTLRAAPDRVSALCTKLLIAAEDEARMGRVGHWRDGLFSLRTPEQLINRVGTFQIVEGMVQTATVYKGRAYINFGADYRKDFTVTVAPADMKLFRQARFDVKKLAGRRIRARGWVELYNGPEMEIATPGAIQALD